MGKAFIELVKQYAPSVIHDEVQARRTEEVIERFLKKGADTFSQDEIAYVELLSQLLSDWEEENVEIPEVSGQDLIRVLMEDRELSNRDLVRAGIFATDSVASEVLSGHRNFTTAQVARLSEYFRLPADLFLPELQRA